MAENSLHRWEKRRGGAVLLVILLIPILVFLARAVAWLSSSSHFRTLSHRDKISNTYLMEAGLNHALTLLKEDSEWKEGFDHKGLSHVKGSYSITFQEPGEPYVPGNSVNNISGFEAVDGPRGPRTVMPLTIELVVNVENGRSESSGVFVMEAILKNLSEIAIGSAGDIVMNGNVNITGVQDVLNWVPVNSGIHSNKPGSSADPVIEWTPKRAGDKATFSGKVSTTATGPNAIQFTGTQGTDFSASAFEEGAARMPTPSPDIVTAVQQNRSATDPPVNNFGTTTLGAQDYHSQGNLELQGDLVLENGVLYVEGDLVVNGSITGDGSIFVTGKTIFKGEAAVRANETGIALYSEGPIQLKGFNGREFVERLLSNPSDRDTYNQAMATFKAEMHVASNKTPNAPQREAAAKAQQALGTIKNLIARELNRQLGVQGSAETADFIESQLAIYDNLVGFTAQHYPHKKEFRETTAQLNNQLDRLGTAYFQGLMVSNTYIHAESSVGVVGAMYATGKNADVTDEIDGETVKSGDIFLNDNCEMVFNRELLDEPEAKSNEVERFLLRAWVR